jgi:hypothetical protein
MLFIDARKLGTLVDRTRKEFADKDIDRIAGVSNVDELLFSSLACNLSNLDAALRGGLLDLIKVRLMCVGAGPTLDYADAAEFLAG